MDSGFNRHIAIFQLLELQKHLADVIEEIEAGRYDDETGDLSYPVALGHLMDHLVLAWHYSRMSDEDVDNVSQDHFEQLTNAIPKFNISKEYRLVELHERCLKKQVRLPLM